MSTTIVLIEWDGFVGKRVMGDAKNDDLEIDKQ
jgi:hypothetical protein